MAAIDISPGLVAEPLGMFSQSGTHTTRLILDDTLGVRAARCDKALTGA